MRTVIAIKQRTRIALEEKHENFIAATQKKNQFFLKTICTCYYSFSSLRVRRLKGRGRLILSAVKLVPRNKTKQKNTQRKYTAYTVRYWGLCTGQLEYPRKNYWIKTRKEKIQGITSIQTSLIAFFGHSHDCQRRWFIWRFEGWESGDD